VCGACSTIIALGQHEVKIVHRAALFVGRLHMLVALPASDVKMVMLKAALHALVQSPCLLATKKYTADGYAVTGDLSQCVLESVWPTLVVRVNAEQRAVHKQA
jgi:hypothetical protein